MLDSYKKRKLERVSVALVFEEEDVDEHDWKD